LKLTWNIVVYRQNSNSAIPLHPWSFCCYHLTMECQCCPSFGFCSKNSQTKNHNSYM